MGESGEGGEGEEGSFGTTGPTQKSMKTGSVHCGRHREHYLVKSQEKKEGRGEGGDTCIYKEGERESHVVQGYPRNLELVKSFHQTFYIQSTTVKYYSVN